MSMAVVFPGQGSQSCGMLAALAAADPVVEQTFAEASGVLGYDLWQLVQHGPEAELNRTEVTQPAMLTAGIAVWRHWLNEAGPRPDYLAGHSLGEYTALVAAEALSFPEAVALVADRGRYMQAAVPEGEGLVAAILGLPDATVSELCRQAASEGTVSCANYNAPGQVVIAGRAAAVRRAVELATEAGARRAVVLPVSVPVHCPLMRPAAERMRERLASVRLSPPRIPVVHNLDARPRQHPDEIREALVAQVASPVQWVRSVRWLADEGVDTIYEFGPGRVLTGLCRRIDRSLRCLPVYDPDTAQAALDLDPVP